MTSRIELAYISRDLREIILVVFPLFSRKIANAPQVSDFEETVQTQYLIIISLQAKKRVRSRPDLEPTRCPFPPPLICRFVSLKGLAFVEVCTSQ